MKNFLTKLLCIFAFILCFAMNAFAADLNITSVVYDNSSSFLSINTPDNDEYTFNAQPKLYVIEDEKKAYFDINSAILRCPAQDLVISSAGIKEVMVKQFSTDPNIVRVVIYYNEGFNPKNIQLKRINNTLFVRFATTQISNYYFQHIYSDLVDSVQSLYESTSIQTTVQSLPNTILSQIDSAFNLGATTEDKNYILTKKDLVLPTKYFVDGIDIKNSTAYITGIGTITVSSPIRLSNPTRIAYDIPNAFVNQAIRNKEFYISQNETIKIGQFDRSTARIVITSPTAERYIPVIYGDAQRLAIIDKLDTNPQSLYSSNATFNSVIDEGISNNIQSAKLVFSKPIILGIERTSSAMDIIFYNVNKTQDINLASIALLKNAKVSALNTGGFKLSIPSSRDNIIDLHLGTDAKTLRIKEKVSTINAEVEPPVVVEPVVISKVKSKKYIVIDPGHGGSDVGCTRNNIYEKNITLDISKRVRDLLEKKGYEVVMTREKDATVSLQDRVAISEAAQPDIFVSIHVNSSNSDSPNGIETHYYKDNSLMLAKTLHASMLNHVKANDRGLFKSKFYVINHTTAPAVLLEIGFISNPTERAQLVSESRKQSTAKAIAEGIDGYFK